jgi:peptide/nickel transport system permease protein
VSTLAQPSGASPNLVLEAAPRIRAPRILFRIAIVWLVLLLIVAATVQWLPLHSYVTPAGLPNQNPHWGAELLGTDSIGRSMLSRLAYGARLAVVISLLATGIGMALGGVLGLLAAYFPRSVGIVADIFTNSLLAIPSLLLLLAIVLALRPSFFTVTGSLGLIFIPAFMRLTRANALSQLGREYVTASRAMGAGHVRIIFREVMPNTMPSLLSYALIVLPGILITEGSLSFLGFGIQPPTPTWGNQIALGIQDLASSPWQVLIPCILLSVTVFALNTIGDRFRTRIEI